MAQYRVKATIDVEFRVEADSAEIASYKAAMQIFNVFLDRGVTPTLEIRRSEVREEDH